MTKEEVEQAILWKSTLLCTELPDRELTCDTFLNFDHVKVIDKETKVCYPVHISTLSIKLRASTFCNINCDQGDYKVGGKCYYMGCIQDDDKLADDVKV